MRNPHKPNKRGVVLAYVIGISAAILVLSAALFSMSSYNLTMSHKASDSRQAYLSAHSAVAFAQGEIAKQAALTASEDVSPDIIRNGVAQKTFYVKKENVNDLSVVNDKPDVNDFAAQCDLKLIKTEHFGKVNFRIWVGGIERKDFAYKSKDAAIKPPTSWKASDNEQIMALNNKDEDPLTHVSYKPFPFDEIVAETGMDLAYRISVDHYTIYTYQADIAANVKYNSSKHSEQLHYTCTVKPGYDVTHTAIAPRPEGSDFVVPGAQYGNTVLMNGASYPYDTAPTSLNQSVKSDFPVVFPLGFTLDNKASQSFSAPSIFIMNTLSGSITATIDAYKFDSNFVYLTNSIDELKNKGMSNVAVKTNAIIRFAGDKYYKVNKDNVNLIDIKDGDLTLLTPEDVRKNAQIPHRLIEDIEMNYSKMITGDSSNANRGCNWTINGAFTGGSAPSSKTDSHVNWYILDSANWDSVLTANKNIYQAEKINMQGRNTALTVPNEKNVTLKSNMISISGISKISGGIGSKFILSANDGDEVVSVTGAIDVSGGGKNYKIKPGIYVIPTGTINLFSNEGARAFNAPMSGNATGGGDNVNNEETPGTTKPKSKSRDMELKEGHYAKQN